MSQSSFLEDVMCWSPEECQQRHKEAVPKLVSYFQQAENYHGEIGVLKILCQCFVPCMDLDMLEKSFFSRIYMKTRDSFEKILADVRGMVGTTQDNMADPLKDQIMTLLELLLDVLDCVEGSVRCLQGAHDSVELGHIHSLQPLALCLLQTTFGHCKESASIYQELITTLSDPLSNLFRKAYSLQMAYLGLLDKVVVGFDTSEEDVQDLCAVCEGLYRISQIVTSLDVKISIILWKAISKYVTQHKVLLKERLDLSSMVIYLCTEIQTGYSYLFTIVPQLDQYGQPLTSQGDEKAFVKSVKILGFQMKVLVMLIKEYQGFLADCERSVYILLLHLHKMHPPSLSAPCLQPTHQEEIERQLMNATEPILTHLLDNDRFITCLTSTDTESPDDGLSLAHLQLRVTSLGILPGLSEEVQDKWIDPKVCPEDEPREGLLESLFTSVDKCFVEMSSRVQLPGVMCSGKAQRWVGLYEHVCTRLCGFVGSLPAKHFHILESCLLRNVVCGSPFCSQMATDVWCFVSRYGSADLCLSHVTMLCDLMRSLPYNDSLEYRNLSVLLSRLVAFMAPEHQESLLSLCPPSENLRLWSVIPVSSLPSLLCEMVLSEVMPCCIKSLNSWINNPEKSWRLLNDLNRALRVLCNIYKSRSFHERISPQMHGLVMEKYSQLWHCLPALLHRGPHLCCENVQLLLQLGGYLTHLLQNKDVLQILYVSNKILQEEAGLELKLSVCQFLRQCGKLKLPPSFEQTQALSRLPQLFFKLLTDAHDVVQYSACQAFTLFAEETPHEAVVSDCLQNNERLQNQVMKHINKNNSGKRNLNKDLQYLKAQKTKLDEFKKMKPSDRSQQWKVSVVEEQINVGLTEAEDDIPVEDDEPSSKRLKLDDPLKLIDDECKELVKSTQNNIGRLRELFKSGSLPSWVIGDLAESLTHLTDIIAKLKDDS